MRVIQTERAPKAIGPYSQAIVANGFIFTAGQLGLDPATGELAAGGIEAQTRQALRNLQAVVEAAGGSLTTVVKTLVFLQNMDDFAAMNKVYSEFFQINPPARSAVQAARLPRAAMIEIEAVALLAE